MEILSAALLQLLAAVITVVAGFLVNYVKKKIGTEKLKEIQEQLATKKELAILAVKFVEQAYKDFDGQQKYDEAAKWLSNRANDLKLKISEEEIKGLVEAALRQIKDELGDNWVNSK